MTARSVRLLAVLAIALALRLAFFTGLMGSDDLHYRDSARGILEGRPPVGEFSHSVAPGMALPMAAFYAVLGPGEAGTAAFPLVMSLIHVLVAFELGRRLFSEREGMIAALLVALYPLDVVFATQALPDVPIAALAGAGALAFLRGEEERLAGRGGSGWFLLCGLLVGIAYLVKITAVFVTLFFGLYALVRRRFSARWAVAAGGAIAVFAAETLYYRAVAGEWWYRVRAIFHTNVVIMGQGGYRTDVLEYPFYFFLNPQRCGLYYYLLLPALALAIAASLRQRTKPRGVHGDALLTVLWFAAVFGYLEFGLESFRPLLLIHKEIRFTALLTLPLVLLVAWLIAGRTPRWRTALIAAVAATSVPAAAVAAAAHRATFANARAIAEDLRCEPASPVYASHYEAQYLRFLLGPPHEERVHAYNDRVLSGRFPVDLATVKAAYVVVDRETDEEHHRKARRGFRLPPEIADVPEEWQLVREYPARKAPFLRLVGDAALFVLATGVLPDSIAARLRRTVERTVGIAPAALYRLP